MDCEYVINFYYGVSLRRLVNQQTLYNANKYAIYRALHPVDHYW